MKRSSAIVAGFVAGIVAAGPLAALAIVLLPPAWRTERVVLAGAGVVVVFAMWSVWRLSAHRRL